MAAVWLLLRSGWRRHRWQQLALAGLTALTVAMVLAVLAGARRTETAFDRFEAWSRVPELLISVDGANGPVFDDDQIAAARSLPGVRASAMVDAMGIIPVSSVQGQPPPAVAKIDDAWATTIARPRYVRGRAPVGTDEIAMSEQRAAQLGLRLGGTVRMASFTPEQIRALQSGKDAGAPAGPLLELELVGIERTPSTVSTDLDIASVSNLSPAFYRRYRDRIGSWAGRMLALDLEGGPSTHRAVLRDLRTIPGLAELQVQLNDGGGNAVSSTLSFVALGLSLLAAVLALGGLAAIGLVMGRAASGGADDLALLSALGMAGKARRGVLLLRPAPAILSGVVLGLIGAASASALFPFGLGRRAEPTPGFAINWSILAIGGALAAGIVAALAAVIAWRGSRPRRPGRARRSSSVLVGADAPVPVTLGSRFALDRGAAGGPSRAAIAGVAVGAAGMVSALVFASSAARLMTHEPDFGRTWDFALEDVNAPEAAEVIGSDAIEASSEIRHIPLEVNGTPVNTRGYRLVTGSSMIAVADGRAPGPGEVALGRATMDALGVEIGDRVRLSGPSGTAPLKVVGQAMFSGIEDQPAIATGVAVDEATLSRVADPNDPETRGPSATVVRLRSSADRSSARTRLVHRYLAGASPSEIDQGLGTRQPDEFRRLREIRPIPWLVAICLGSLAVVATSALLITAVHRRRRDVAVLRASGLDRRQARLTVAAQATVVSLLGLAVGLPLGLVIGRLLWRSVADDLGVLAVTTVPVGWLVAGVATVAVFDAAVSAIPARRAAAIPVATELRAE